VRLNKNTSAKTDTSTCPSRPANIHIQLEPNENQLTNHPKTQHQSTGDEFFNKLLEGELGDGG
jgi:hypothetical protein